MEWFLAECRPKEVLRRNLPDGRYVLFLERRVHFHLRGEMRPVFACSLFPCASLYRGHLHLVFQRKREIPAALHARHSASLETRNKRRVDQS